VGDLANGGGDSSATDPSLCAPVPLRVVTRPPEDSSRAAVRHDDFFIQVRERAQRPSARPEAGASRLGMLDA
jgi:hypothetical protein